MNEVSVERDRKTMNFITAIVSIKYNLLRLGVIDAIQFSFQLKITVEFLWEVAKIVKKAKVVKFFNSLTKNS